MNRGWLIGVDFGNTFSAAGLLFLGNENIHCKPGTIVPVKKYPSSGYTGPMYSNYREVPSELRYERHFTKWGYQVQAILNEAKILPGHRINHPKLMLDESPGTLELRRNKEAALSTIPGDKTGETVIADYLTELFKHIHWYMLEYHGYHHEDPIELVCTVPVLWTQSAIRKMIAAVEEAQRRADFGFGRDVEDVYTVSEPEAAAAHVLANHPNLGLQKGDTFTVCDAGGGTVDLITYTVDSTEPWRLTEAVDGQGAPCGSNFINLAFETHLKERLESEQYLNEDDANSMQEKIDAAVLYFEKNFKPDFGPSNDQSSTRTIVIPGLRRDERRGFYKDKICITHSDLLRVFRPVVDQAWNLVWSQIGEVWKHSLCPKMLLLVGGFAGSPFLRNHIVQMCRSEASRAGMQPIRVVTPENPEFAIASGAICRAADKENGPSRRSRSSIGVQQHIPYEKKNPLYKDIEPWYDDTDGKQYVRDCLDWLITKGELIPPTGYKAVREYYHTISVDDETCVLTARIYVLDRPAASFYPTDHTENEGCEFQEKVCFEFSKEQLAHLKEVLPRKPRGTSKQQKGGHKPMQPPNQPLRKSNRNLHKPNGKSRESQYYGFNRGSPLNSIVPREEQSGPRNEDIPIYQTSFQPRDDQAAQPVSHPVEMDAPTAKFQELALHESNNQLQGCVESSHEYIEITYELIVEVNGLRLNYCIECTVGEVTYRAAKKFNLAKVFAPGTA